tara:strand:- start:833 stop:1009 length:177 start_codon:yes stop_codon:yes gene_type:complete
MKLNPTSIRQPISDDWKDVPWEHPWYAESERLKRPTPPTQAAIAKAQFVDKTYTWKTK